MENNSEKRIAFEYKGIHLFLTPEKKAVFDKSARILDVYRKTAEEDPNTFIKKAKELNDRIFAEGLIPQSYLLWNLLVLDSIPENNVSMDLDTPFGFIEKFIISLEE